MVQCSGCGATTADLRAFGQTRGGWGAARYCRSCLEAANRRHAARTVALVVGGGALGAALMVTHQGVIRTGSGARLDLGAVLLFWSAVYVCSFVHVVPHELGHAIVGRICGFRVPRVTVGVGALVVERQVGRTSIEIRALPVSGVTYGTTQSTRALRLRLWLFAAAGPATTGAVTLLAWKLLQGGTAMWVARTLSVFVLAGVIMLVSSLLPLRIQGQASDGRQLLTIPFLSAAQFEATAVPSHLVDAVELDRRGRHGDAAALAQQLVAEYPQDLRRQRLLVMTLLKGRRWPEASIALREQLGRDDLDHQTRLLHLNNLAWSNLMIGDPDLLPEADRASAEAYAGQPWRHAFCGTRGSVLIELGDAERGMALLEASKLRSQTPESIASTHAYLALGALARGNRWGAREHYATARAAWPDHAMLPRVRRALAAADLPDAG